MAPGLRSGRTGHPEADPAGADAGGGCGGGCSPLRTDTGGEGRCLRTRWQAGSGGMLANCLLSVGMLVLLVRCALAAEEKSTYDASGSSSLPGDPAATAAPAHPLADLSVAEEVPFSVVQSDADSESEAEGLSGQPVFSSVLTVMAGTVKHPVSLVPSRTSPTITRDENHTTQWPSHSSSPSLQMSSSSSSVGANRNVPASSGLTLITPYHHATPSPPSASAASAVSGPSHLMDENRNASVFSSSPAPPPPSSPSPSPSPPPPSTVSSSVLSLFPPDERMHTVASSPRHPPLSKAISQTKAVTLAEPGSRGRTDRPEDSQPTAVTHGRQSASAAPSDSVRSEIVTETSSEQSNKAFYLSADAIDGASETYENNSSMKAAKTPANNSLSSHSNLQILPSGLSYGDIQSQSPAPESLLANNHETSSSFPSNQESQVVQRQQAASPNPTSVLLSPRPKGYSVSSHVTEHMLNRAARPEDEAAVVSQTSVHKSVGKAIMSPFHSHTVNPSVTTATFSTSGSFLTVSSVTPPGKSSPSEARITTPTPIHSGMGSLEHASNPDDLLMAAGHSSPRAPAININYNQGAIAGPEFTSISSQAYLNNSLFLTQPRPVQSTSGSFQSLIAPAGEASSLSASETVHMSSNGVINDHRFVRPTAFPKSVTQEGREPTTPKETFPSHSRTVSHSSSALPLKSASLTLSPNKSDLTVPSAKVSASIKFERHDHSIPATGVYVTGRSSAADSLHRNTTKTLVSPSSNVNQESTHFKDTAFYKKVSSEQFSTKLPSFVTTKDAVVVHQGSDRSDKSPSTNTSFSPRVFNVTTERLTSRPGNDDVTLVARYAQSSSSSWSEINLTLKTNSTPRSQGPLVPSSGDKSHFYLGRKTTIFFSASSAAATSPSDGQHRTAIFSFGPQPLAHYTKWKTNKPVPFQTSAFKSENTSVGPDRPRSNLQTDGPSHHHPKLEDEQQSNVHILNGAHPTAAATDPYSSDPSEREHYGGDYGSFTHVKDTPVSNQQSDNLSSADPRSAAAVGATLNVPASSDSPTDSVTSSQAASPAPWYNSKPPVSDVASVGFVSDAAVTHNSSPSFSHADNINNLTESELTGVPLPSELVPSPFPFRSSSLTLSSSSLSSSQTALLYLSSVTASGSSLRTKPPEASSVLSSSSSSSSSSSTVDVDGSALPTEPTAYPGTASSSVSLKPTPQSSPPSPSVTSSLDSDASHGVTETFVVLTETGTDELTAGTSKAVAFPKEKEAGLAPSQSVRITLSAGPTERTPQVSPLTPRPDTTTASVKLTTTPSASNTKPKSPNTTMPSPGVTAGDKQTTTTTTPPSTTTTTPRPTPATRRTPATTTRTQTSRRTVTPSVLRTSPPRAATTHFISPFTTTTESPPQQCNITERMWVRTVVSIYVRRNRLDSIQRQNLRRGLSQGLRKALNDSFAQAQVETVFGSPNMTVAYHVTGADMVYPPSVVQEGLNSYGRDKLIADLRQYLPMVTALPLAVALWRPSPATGFQLKTVLQFVGAGDDPRSCRFSQMMEQRLEKVFSEAQAKVFSTNSRLAVQMLSVSQAAGSPAVSLVYSVKNGTVFLNGTTASNLLGQLSAELVGYFLFYPPLIIAEPMEYHNLNTSIGTRDFWVITVIQDVDNTSLEGQYQSFASLMEQRLAELFVLAGQQGTRFRRATTVGSYTVQMVNIRRVSGLKNPAEMTYYVQHNGVPLSGTSAAKVLNTVDSQTMALTLGYFVQLQAEPVVKNPPNNLWIIAAVLAPIAVVTLIIIIITAVLCRKNKNDFKADAIGNLNPRAKMAYRRDVGYYHQPVQGFDYAKQHLGQQGGDEETLPASQDTLVMSLQIRDTPLSLEKALQQDGTANKKTLTSDKHKSKLPSEDGSVISNESEKLNSGRGLTALKVTAQQKLTKEESRKRDDPYDTSSGSLQLISIKPMVAQPNYSHPASSDRSQDSAIVNGEVNMALKQKSDIEHYRNKLRLKAKRKGYYDFPSTDGSSSCRALSQRQRHGHETAAGEHGRPMEPDDERGSTYVKSHRRHSQVGQTAYRSRQSLSSPSPGGTEMDLLVMRERPRRGIRNSGYDTEPELIEETNVDRLVGPRGYMYGRGLKGHSETSTLSSQPSIDEVRQQMHLLLEEAFSLASGGQSTSGRHSHHHHHQPPPGHYSPAPPPLPYADVVTSAPGTMSCGPGGLQWVPSYGADVYQCSLPKPAFRFTQLPEMAMGSPPPLPPRTGPPPGTSLRRSTSDLGPKGRSSETSVTGMQSQHENNPYGPTTRAALPSITAEQPVSNYSGNPITAVYAIPASRSGYSEYFVSTPPTSYHSPSWMSYPPEPEDVPPQWADSVPLPGYVEAFPHPRYPQGSPMRLPLQYNQALEQPPSAPSTASQQSLPPVVKDMDSMPLSSLSTSALVQAIRQEVAKLAKKQNDIFEF